MKDKNIKKGIKVLRKYLDNENGFGMYEIIGTAAVLVVAAFIIIPQFRDFAQTVMLRLNSWFSTSIASKIFPTA